VRRFALIAFFPGGDFKRQNQGAPRFCARRRSPSSAR
jgi:hypothetical protein